MTGHQQRDLTRAPGGGKPPARGGNLRTALILLSIAAVFFVGVIVNRWLFGG